MYPDIVRSFRTMSFIIFYNLVFGAVCNLNMINLKMYSKKRSS